MGDDEGDGLCHSDLCDADGHRDCPTLARIAALEDRVKTLERALRWACDDDGGAYRAAIRHAEAAAKRGEGG